MKRNDMEDIKGSACKGCNDYDNECWVLNIEDCPCQLCLVKVTCKKSCKVFKEFEKIEFTKQGGKYISDDQEFGWN